MEQDSTGESSGNLPELGPVDDLAVLEERRELAESYTDDDRYDEAARLYEANVRDVERLYGPDHDETLLAREDLAAVHSMADHYDEAIAQYEALVRDCTRIRGADDDRTLNTRQYLASVYRWAERYGEAIVLFEALLRDCEHLRGADDAKTLRARKSLAEVYTAVKCYEEAGRLCAANLRSLDATLTLDDLENLSAQKDLGWILSRACQFDAAVALYEKLLPSYQRTLGPDHDTTQQVRKSLEHNRSMARSAPPSMRDDVSDAPREEVSTVAGDAAIVVRYADGTVSTAVPRAAADPADSAIVRELVTIGTTRRFLRTIETRRFLGFGARERSIAADERTVEIGRLLNEQGGLESMRAVHAAVASRVRHIPGVARELEVSWNGIGKWQG
ncbi:tetratricopeptide repeat protein [Nocardia sp. XZ_19_385]|uniref:tetratricopeptide repeat protein n=1 Tax=Nocardia sp. XZ_19_385 TaxID=2769488 RepID=UPI00188F4AC1|nr:tetratricopeptide repeat protein [Nocardia sp. XZ_19_385]